MCEYDKYLYDNYGERFYGWFHSTEDKRNFVEIVKYVQRVIELVKYDDVLYKIGDEVFNTNHEVTISFDMKAGYIGVLCGRTTYWLFEPEVVDDLNHIPYSMIDYVKKNFTVFGRIEIE